MDWKQQFKFHDLSRRNTSIIILLLLAFNLFILILSSNSLIVDSEEACCTHCASNQRWIYNRIIREVPDGEGFELPSEWTVADLILEAVGKNLQTSHPFPENAFICRNVRKVREHAFPYLRRQRVEVTSPYLVFPVPASAVFDQSIPQPVPILMCPPGAHGDKRGSMVLFSDGSTIRLPREEAEKLVAEQSPIPFFLKNQSESAPAPESSLSEDRQE